MRNKVEETDASSSLDEAVCFKAIRKRVPLTLAVIWIYPLRLLFTRVGTGLNDIFKSPVILDRFC